VCFLTRQAGNVYSVNIQLNSIVLCLFSCGLAMQQEKNLAHVSEATTIATTPPPPLEIADTRFYDDQVVWLPFRPQGLYIFCIYVLGRGETNILNYSTHTLDLMCSFS
jgi:hypothetical protein